MFAMDYFINMKYFGVLLVASVTFQDLRAASLENKMEPMVAFTCGLPAVYRTPSGWLADRDTGCLNKMPDILAYCKKVYPDHNVTNVVESSYLVNIPNWPMVSTDHQHSHRVRPYRCQDGDFQSDALLVPQHCEFDHRHDQALCMGFDYWNTVADEACQKKVMHLESFGMLLNCQLGKFSGVEYVCCPNNTETVKQPTPENSHADKGQTSSEEEDEDYEEDEEVEKDSSEEDDDEDENTVDLYEAYVRGQEFPTTYNNEHKKFLAAKERMKKNQQRKITKLLQAWQVARDQVSEIRKSDVKAADKMAQEIAERFQNLYAAYGRDDEAEREQLTTLHLQHIQAALNEKKTEALGKYIKALENQDVSKVMKYLVGYIKAEQKDRLHTVNHYQHLKSSAPREAARVHPFIKHHLQLSEQRMDQSMDMLKHYPDIDAKVRPQIEEFLKRFEAVANSIREVVLSEPKLKDTTETTSQSVNNEETNTDEEDEDNDNGVTNNQSQGDEIDSINQDIDEQSDGSEVAEGHADDERENTFVAHHKQDVHHVQQGVVRSAAVTSGHIGSTVGIVLGSASVFVIILVAIVMLKRSKSRQTVSHGYVEVDPSTSPEDRHLANMQMNGYENPTYKYFEVQTNPKA